MLSPEDWTRFVDAANECAAARGRVFLLDEGRRMFGERAWASYLQGLMLELGLEEMAARLDPEQFPAGGDPSAFTKLPRGRALGAGIVVASEDEASC